MSIVTWPNSPRLDSFRKPPRHDSSWYTVCSRVAVIRLTLSITAARGESWRLIDGLRSLMVHARRDGLRQLSAGALERIQRSDAHLVHRGLVERGPARTRCGRTRWRIMTLQRTDGSSHVVV